MQVQIFLGLPFRFCQTLIRNNRAKTFTAQSNAIRFGSKIKHIASPPLSIPWSHHLEYFEHKT